MNIKSEMVDDRGKKFILDYSDCDDFSILPAEQCTQTYGVCFVDDKIVIGLRAKLYWGLIGGTIEKGETFDETFAREIKEESNMEVLKKIPVGYQKVTLEEGRVIYQLRYVAIVRPFGPFVEDPAGAIKEIKLIDPKDYKQYFDWGEIGERIIQRALELKSKL